MSALSNEFKTTIQNIIQHIYNYNSDYFKTFKHLANKEITNLFTWVLIPAYLLVWLLTILLCVWLAVIKIIKPSTILVYVVILLIFMMIMIMFSNHFISKYLNQILSMGQNQLIDPYETVMFDNSISNCKINYSLGLFATYTACQGVHPYLIPGSDDPDDPIRNAQIIVLRNTVFPYVRQAYIYNQDNINSFPDQVAKKMNQVFQSMFIPFSIFFWACALTLGFTLWIKKMIWLTTLGIMLVFFTLIVAAFTTLGIVWANYQFNSIKNTFMTEIVDPYRQQAFFDQVGQCEIVLNQNETLNPQNSYTYCGGITVNPILHS